MSTVTTSKQAKYRVMGENDDASECACCGRTGLKRVVWMQPLDEDGNEVGEAVPFGRVCGAKAAGWGYGSSSDIDRRIVKELKETAKHYNALASKAIRELEQAGKIVLRELAYAVSHPSPSWYGTPATGYSRGFCYVLPGDPILEMTPGLQVIELDKAVARMTEAYPICKWMRSGLKLEQLIEMLG